MLDRHSHAPLTVLFQLVYNDLRQTTTKIILNINIQDLI